MIFTHSGHHWELEAPIGMFLDIDHMNVHIDDFHTFRTSLEILDNTGYC